MCFFCCRKKNIDADLNVICIARHLHDSITKIAIPLNTFELKGYIHQQ